MTISGRAAVGAMLRSVFIALVCAYLLLPLIVVVGGSFSAPDTGQLVTSFVEFPPRHWTLAWYFLISGETYRALALSFGLGLAAACIACLLGVPAALGLVRGQFRGKGIAAALFRAPLQVPAVVAGVGLLQSFYLLGDLTGLDLPGTVAGLLVGHVFLALPFAVGSVVATLQRFDPRLEEAALSLGETRVGVLRRVTLPIIMPGILTGAIYGFLVSFIDVPVSLFLSGAGLVPYPVELFSAMEQEFNPSLLASATLVILFSLLLLVAIHRLLGLDRLLHAGS
ncbi:MAG TPA: ABC transporter permease [Stellaceae bacterium]|jgi:putative spermidine/putrescine transport system permease protein|nr:ABC transporter permease [Stellaceae bacterium]